MLGYLDTWTCMLGYFDTWTCMLGYLDTWSGFEAAKPAPWPSRGFHHLSKFYEPKMSELVEMLLLPDAVTELGIFGSSEMSSRNLLSSNLIFSVLTLSMSLGYFGNELYNRGPNTVIALF